MKDKLKRALDAGEWIDTDSELYPAYQSLLIECGIKTQRYNSTVVTKDVPSDSVYVENPAHKV